MDAFNLIPVIDEGLGYSTNLLDLGEVRALDIEVGCLADHPGGVPAGLVIVMCGDGEHTMATAVAK